MERQQEHPGKKQQFDTKYNPSTPSLQTEKEKHLNKEARASMHCTNNMVNQSSRSCPSFRPRSSELWPTDAQAEVRDQVLLSGTEGVHVIRLFLWEYPVLC